MSGAAPFGSVPVRSSSSDPNVSTLTPFTVSCGTETVGPPSARVTPAVSTLTRMLSVPSPSSSDDQAAAAAWVSAISAASSADWVGSSSETVYLNVMANQLCAAIVVPAQS